MITSLRMAGVFLLAGMLLLTGCGPSAERAAAPTDDGTAQAEGPGAQRVGAEEVEARVEDFLARVEEETELTEDQLDRLRAVAEEHFASTVRMLQRQGDGDTGEGKGPRPEGERPGMEGGAGQGQQRQELTDELHTFLSDEQAAAVLGVLDEIRKEMFLERTIHRIGGETPGPGE